MLGGNSSSELQDHHREALVSSEGPSLSTSPSDQGNNTLTLFLHSTSIPVVPAEVEFPSSQINHHSRPPPRKSREYRRWTQEEHMLFLHGLELYEKGDWINISRKVVKTRTPTQVASHAQKYFLRQAPGNRGQRRSIHDITLQDPVPHRIDHQNLVASSSPSQHQSATLGSTQCNTESKLA